MNKSVLSALLLMPVAALAASAFDGTWKTRTGSLKVTGKADVFQVVDGVYTCSSCVPEVKVKADGADHKVSGHDYYDTVSVKVVSPSSLEIINKKGEKLANSVSYSVSTDGATLTGRFKDYSGAKVATGTFTETRQAAGPAGSSAVSGSWQLNALSDANDAARTVALRMTDQQFTMHSNGQSYAANFDGKQVRVHGDPGHTMVSLKKIDDNSVQETDYRGGKVTDEIQMVTAKDGKTMEVTDKDLVHGQTVTFTSDKQP